MQLFAIVEAGEVYARAARLAEALEKELAVVPGHVVLARHVKHFFLAKALQNLVQRVEFGGLEKDYADGLDQALKVLKVTYSPAGRGVKIASGWMGNPYGMSLRPGL